MNRTKLKDTFVLITDIIAYGIYVAMMVVTMTLMGLAIYSTAGLNYLELIGTITGMLTAFGTCWMVAKTFLDDKKFEIDWLFWVAAFCIGGSITAQYILHPDAVMSLPTMLTAACMIALPTWGARALNDLVGLFRERISIQKRKHQASLTTQTDEVSAAMQRLADDGQIAGRIVLPGKFHNDQPERKMWYEY